jgi:hypothetical protein
MDARLRDHEYDRRIKFADVSDDREEREEEKRKVGSVRKDIAEGKDNEESSRFVRVKENEVSRLHRQTRSTGNGSLASSIKRVTYQRGKNSQGAIAAGETHRDGRDCTIPSQPNFPERMRRVSLNCLLVF